MDRVWYADMTSDNAAHQAVISAIRSRLFARVLLTGGACSTSASFTGVSAPIL
jgi:hypothetical protein